jgi:N-carbamoyl-L-amino-acid hydrolase
MPIPNSPSIDGARLIADLKRIAEFGRYKTGVHRPCLSPQDMQSRHWLAERMKEAGLEPTIDGIGNVIGRSGAAGPKLLLGSHTDTQPQGGWLDGVMGVIYGLEVARALKEAGAPFGVDVASWADEEGHFGAFPGSRSFVGELSEAEIAAAKHRDDGTPLTEALEKAGLAGRPRLAIEPERYLGYVEAHIEQGGYLEHERKRIGVVTAIVGIFQYRITFAGQQNHAGTTPMHLRKDAGQALIRFCTAINDAFPAVAGPRSVWTVGRVQFQPGAPAIVPGAAETILQFRDEQREVMERMEAALMHLVAAAQADGPCSVEIETLSRTFPTVMDGAFQDAIEAAARIRAPDAWMRMPSAAGHDAQIIAHKLPAAMLFVPSIGGISHHYSEDTAEADIVLGCQVLADAVTAILKA